MDYYSLLRKVEEDLRKQSNEVMDAFTEANFLPKYVSLSDGEIQENQLIICQEIYGIIHTMISPESDNKFAGIIKIYTTLQLFCKKNNVQNHFGV